MRFRLDYLRIVDLPCECCSDFEPDSDFYSSEKEARKDAVDQYEPKLYQILEDGSEIEIDLEG